jgi:signal transduction histidine kinase
VRPLEREAVRRLYLQIYLAFVGILVLFGALLAAAWWLLPTDGRDEHMLDGMALLFSEALPAQREGIPALQASLSRLAAEFNADVNVRAANGTLLAVAGAVLAPPPPDLAVSSWLFRDGRGATLALNLPDGRWVVARLPHRHRPWGLPFALMLMLAAIAAGSYPVVRRITGRLERLQSRVEALGAGDLKARVQIEGRDEVAELARSFNAAAQRIEQLVNGYRGLLANVSHELRTPLTRMRMALELLPSARPELRERVAKDIAELDELIGELLLASRLDTLEAPLQREELDLLALAAEEACAVGAHVEGASVSVSGDVRLLRRLIRNLLQNAQRHAPGAPVGIEVAARTDGGAALAVWDRGPGIPAAERERIFDPFYRVPGTQGEGSGLGLALVRQIARHHGGSVRCLEQAGGGTRFELELPARAPRA